MYFGQLYQMLHAILNYTLNNEVMKIVQKKTKISFFLNKMEFTRYLFIDIFYRFPKNVTF